MIVYGRNPVREAERGPRRVLRRWEGLPADELERICGSPDHQGVCAEVEPYRYADPDTLLESEDALVLALDEVQDPHNLGAVCRVSAVCKASAGAVEHLAIARVRNLADWLGEAKDREAWIYGASPDGIPYESPDYRGKVVLVLGAEGRGLRPRVAASCDQLVALPVRGRVESLNLSTAAAALVYGILQFRVQS